MPSRSSAPVAVDGGKQPFDIVATYNALLRADPELTMPVAAIEALVAQLATSPSLTTVSETLDLIETSAATLKRAVPNPISLSAGTDLFTRYIVTSLRGSSSGGTGPTGPAGDFAAVRAHLLSNARVFAGRAKEARQAIARQAARLVRPGSTVLTTGGSRVVGAVLREAAREQTRATGAPRFRVVYVTASGGANGPGDSASAPSAGAGAANSTISAAIEGEGAATIAALRAQHVPVAEVGEAAVAYAMGEVTVAVVGAEGVVESGGVISRLGTYQLALLARAMRRPVYVVAESHKFVRLFPLGQYDLGVDQRVLDFRTDGGAADATAGAGPLLPDAGDRTPRGDTPDYFSPVGAARASASAPVPRFSAADAVDYTPPDLLTAIVTEAGVLTPSAVSEELIKIWY